MKKSKESYILTPKAPSKPRINGAKVFGARPGNPFLFKIACTGEKQIQFTADNIPEGLHLDENKGIITGSTTQKGTHKVLVKAENSHGTCEDTLTLKIGENICLAPPMGWNSWYVNSLWVSQKTVKKQVKALHDLRLTDYGWTYINIDDAWQGNRNPDTNILEPNPKFPNMKHLCDYAHSLGIKIGIYSTPWKGSYAGYIGGSSPNKDHDYSKWIVPPEERIEKYQLFGEKGRKRKELRDFGKYMGDYDTKQWAKWGIDYLKYDWCPNDVEHTTQMKESLDKCGRDIIYSLSNSAPFELVEEWKNLANVWRTTGDIIDLWIRVAYIGFRQDKWAPYAGPGHWNDPDMLVIGKTASPHKEHSEYRPTRLSPDEQYSQMSLWCLLSAPLLLSCDIPSLKDDPFTMNLLTNNEVIAVNQDPLGMQARKISKSYFLPKEVWAKRLYDGSFAVGLFNRSRFSQTVKLTFSDLSKLLKAKKEKIPNQFEIRDLWRQKNVGIFKDTYKDKVNGHGVKLLTLKKI